jgi:hypothetical protein
MASSSNWKEMLKNQQADIERLEAMDRELSEQATADLQVGITQELLSTASFIHPHPHTAGNTVGREREGPA